MATMNSATTTAAPSAAIEALIHDLIQAEVGTIKLREPLSRHCTLRIGGPAAALIEPETSQQVAETVRLANQYNVPSVVIGCGSNIFFDDAGLNGLVIKLGKALGGCSIQGDRIYAQAGISIPRLAHKTLLAGLAGYEHMVGIPAALGGLIAMNGGSLGSSIGERVVHVELVDAQGRIRRVLREQCDFSYRHSAFHDSGEIVVAAELRGELGDPRGVRQTMLEILRTRRAKYPLKLPNCGSVFANTPEMYDSFGPPGKVIEDAGLKNIRIGDVQVSSRHANFFVNLGNASSVDFLKTIDHVRKAVFARTGLWLPCEVRYVSPQGKTMSAHLALPLELTDSPGEP